MVLEKLFSDYWLQSVIGLSEKENTDVTELSESILGALCHAQQTTLVILKDIFESLTMNPHLKASTLLFRICDFFFCFLSFFQQLCLHTFLQDDTCLKNNIELIISCARSAKDDITRNHVFMLLSSVARVSPEWLLEQIIDIFSLIGESSIKQVCC